MGKQERHKSQHMRMLDTQQALKQLASSAQECTTPRDLEDLLQPLLRSIWQHAASKDPNSLKGITAFSKVYRSQTKSRSDKVKEDQRRTTRINVKKITSKSKPKATDYIEEIRSLKSDDMSNQKIAEALSVYGVKCSRETIRRILHADQHGQG